MSFSILYNFIRLLHYMGTDYILFFNLLVYLTGTAHVDTVTSN